MTFTLDQLNPDGVFNSAIREFCGGNPEPLALYIKEHGISPGYEAETLSMALREPQAFRKRANNNDRMRELLRIYEQIHTLSRKHGRGFVWREPVKAVSGKSSIYALIAARLNTTAHAVEKAHKKLKQHRKK